jgi:hypothetical protein
MPNQNVSDTLPVKFFQETYCESAIGNDEWPDHFFSVQQLWRARFRQVAARRTNLAYLPSFSGVVPLTAHRNLHGLSQRLTLTNRDLVFKNFVESKHVFPLSFQYFKFPHSQHFLTFCGPHAI